jgi:hypothetical protein
MDINVSKERAASIFTVCIMRNHFGYIPVGGQREREREREKRWTLNMETLYSIETFVSTEKIAQCQLRRPQSEKKNVLVCFIVQLMCRLGYTCPCLFHFDISRETSVGIAMGYRQDGRGSIPGRDKREFSSPQRPDRLWGPPSLPSDGYWGGYLPKGKEAGA